ncbi:MAG: helix-turn-helix domain-containing protein [Paenibacillaceae bacterium]|nr:helix-turn-helix domain-containing protein [Paenibacillaceae bacterium]
MKLLNQTIPIVHKPPHFSLVSVQLVRLPSAWESGKTVQHDRELLAVTAGRGTLALNGARYSLVRGKLFLLAPGANAAFESAADSPLELYRLSFDLRVADAAPGTISAWLLKSGELACDPFYRVEEFLQDVYMSRGGANELDAFRHLLRFQELLAALYDYNRTHTPQSGAVQEVERSIAYMHRHYHDELSVDQLVKESGIGRSQFHALFKSLTGRTPIDYLNGLRINRAKELLLQPGHKLRDVARRAGFRDEYYFSRRFKLAVGVSPGHFAERRGGTLRVVALQFLGELTALGVVPVGAPVSLLQSYGDAAPEMQRLDEPLDVGQIGALRPDLVIVPSFAPRSLTAQLEQLAPAVIVNWFDDIEARLRAIGGMLGKTAEAEAWIARYEAKAEQMRNKLAGTIRPGETATAFIYDGAHRKLFVYGGHNFGHTLYRGLRFSAPAGVRRLMETNNQFKWSPVAFGAMADFAGDRIFLAVTNDEEARHDVRDLLGSEHWLQLPAVANGTAYVVDAKWGHYDPLMLEAHLDEIAQLLGDPH